VPCGRGEEAATDDLVGDTVAKLPLPLGRSQPGGSSYSTALAKSLMAYFVPTLARHAFPLP
jgi:hypothetical protein